MPRIYSGMAADTSRNPATRTREARATLVDARVLATTNLSVTPTLAEITTAFGTPAAVGAGFVGTIDDNGAGTTFYVCGSDGTNWHYIRLVKAT